MLGITSHIADDESPPPIPLKQPFDYFGHTYKQIYVCKNIAQIPQLNVCRL